MELFQNPLSVVGPQKIPENQLANTVFNSTPVPKGGAPEMIDPGGAMIPETSADLKGIEGVEGLLKMFNPAKPVPAPNADPIMQGFQNSDFYKNANQMQQDAVNFKYKGQDMMMNGSMAGALKQYLDSIGQGDLYESDILGGELATVNPITSGNDFMESPDNNAMIPGDLGLYAPVQTAGPPGIESLQNQYKNSYQNNNNNMNNFKNMEKLLQNIDGGIQSLIGNPSYMQNNNNNLSQGLFSKSSSPNFIGGDILQWSSYK